MMNNTLNFLLLIALLLLSPGAFSQGLAPQSLHDVSYLYPLPTSLEQNNLIKAADVLAPRWIQKFPRLSMLQTNGQLMPQMRAVSIRLDPFEKHIRAVWQPLVISRLKTVSTLDMAFHSFHQLSDLEFQKLFQALMNWKRAHRGNLNYDTEALQVHPILARQDQALMELNSIFKSFMQPEKIVKITAMVLRGNNDMWAFMGMEKGEGENLKTVIVARTPNQHQAQSFVNQAVPFDFFDQAEMSGVPYDAPDNLNVFLKKASSQPTLSEQEIYENLGTVLKIENPRITTEDKMDCVHCHIADSSRAFMAKNYPSHFKNFQSPFEFKSPHLNLENKTTEKLNTRQIRGFGYFDSNLAISQRVINDTAHVVESWPFQ